MSQTVIIAMLAVAVIAGALVALSGRRGPRVTTIETRHDNRDGTIETRRTDSDEAEK